ncbi:hypothetical protein K474DRAFT_58777 [Panus rudis PR-1116 ss-1]|nr:hypothetical protein K474DRAFT_58777 [Panus rudis PR-1116 ss-1]
MLWYSKARQWCRLSMHGYTFSSPAATHKPSCHSRKAVLGQNSDVAVPLGHSLVGLENCLTTVTILHADPNDQLLKAFKPTFRKVWYPTLRDMWHLPLTRDDDRYRHIFVWIAIGKCFGFDELTEAIAHDRFLACAQWQHAFPRTRRKRCH